jgi:hypothetical protein
MIEKECKVCSSKFKIYKSRWDHQIYCSKKCKEEDTTIEVICPLCNIIHKMLKCYSKEKRIRYKFCSDNCYKEFIKIQDESKKKEYIKICNNCKKEFIAIRKKTKTGCHFCSQECSIKYQKGINHPSYNGGTSFNNGYLIENVNQKKYKLKHRIVMEQYIGRKLNKNEIVHHIDENKKNNNIENLQLMEKKEHDKYHSRKRHEQRRSAKNTCSMRNLSTCGRVLLNRPISQWNIGKKSEFEDRLPYKIDEECINE